MSETLKISRLITLLQEYKDKHGDIPIKLYDNKQVIKLKKDTDLMFEKNGCLYLGGFNNNGVEFFETDEVVNDTSIKSIAFTFWGSFAPNMIKMYFNRQFSYATIVSDVEYFTGSSCRIYFLILFPQPQQPSPNMELEEQFKINFDCNPPMYVEKNIKREEFIEYVEKVKKLLKRK